jgi:hypothetical protein
MENPESPNWPGRPTTKSILLVIGGPVESKWQVLVIKILAEMPNAGRLSWRLQKHAAL